MSDKKTIQDLFDHIDNITMRLECTIDDYNNAIDRLWEVRAELQQYVDRPGRKKAVMEGDEPDIAHYLSEIGDIWSSVLEDPYDPEY